VELVDVAIERGLGDVAEHLLEAQRCHRVADERLDDAQSDRMEEEIAGHA
jgi:hypothetical protein